MRQEGIKILGDEKENRIVFIPDIIFTGKRRIDWGKVESYVKKYVGNTYEIAETKDLVHIGKDFPDEICGSVYTRNLRGTSAKAKANSVQGLSQLIEIATGKRYQANREKKHEKDAENGWYRYRTRFMLPVFDEKGGVLRYNTFQAALLIRHDANEELYLYDILDVKKETSNPLEQ